MNIDPEGHSFWEWVLGFLLVVVVTLFTAGIAGAAAMTIGSALGVGNALVSATVTGAIIGGLASGIGELVTQGIASNWQTIDFGALAIESFTGAVYGATSGMMGATTSVGLRLVLRGARLGISATGVILEGIHQKKSFTEILANVGISLGTGVLLQVSAVGIDKFLGKLNASVLESLAIDGALFRLKEKLIIAIASFYNGLR